MREENENELRMPVNGVQLMIAEFDGSHVPCVDFKEGEGDKRKRRSVCWHEAKLCMARSFGDAQSQYGATMKGITEAGLMWRRTAIECGAGRNTDFHCLGDGAPSIANQVKEQFGNRGSFLLDFYHLSEYLWEAGQSIAKGRSGEWLKEKQEQLKKNESKRVIEELWRWQESKQVLDKEAPVRRAYRYMRDRGEYLNYKNALERGLPIGSGEIEAGHRNVVQSRLKKSGGWWLKENADKMLSLRVCRANGEWKSYWERHRQANA